MSWQTYVDSNLVGSGKVHRAAILGLQGGVWATSKGYTLLPDEQRAILGCFNNQAETQASGLRLAGQKFFAIAVDKDVVQLKKSGDGAVIVKTKLAILVAEYVAPVQAPEANVVVQSVAEHLKNAGY